MTVTEPQETTPVAQPQGRRLPWWAGALALVLAVAVGVGIGFLLFTPAPSDVDADVDVLLDDWWAAADAGDADTVLSLMPEGGSWGGTIDAYLFSYNVSETPETTLGRVISEWAEEQGPSPAGEPTVIGEVDNYEISQPGTWNGQDYIFVFSVGGVGPEPGNLRVINFNTVHIPGLPAA